MSPKIAINATLRLVMAAGLLAGSLTPATAGSGLQGAISAYLAPMNETADPDALTEQLREGLAHDGGVFWPDAEFGPLTRALLTMHAAEEPVPHSRIRLRLAQRDDPVAGRIYMAEAARFNLGPQRRAELVATLGADVVAPAEHFGTAPDVVWRFVMRPLRGTAAMLEGAARAEPSTEVETCHGQPCDSLLPLAEQLVDWSEPENLVMAGFSPSYPMTAGGVLGEAAALDLMLIRLGLSEQGPEGRPRWTDHEPREGLGDGPFIEVVLEQGLGQDDALDASLVETGLMDHATEAMLLRLQSVAGADGPMIFLWQEARPRAR